MEELHPRAEDFLALIRTTQQAYAERRLADYLSAFDERYVGTQLGSDTLESKTTLAARVGEDMERFDLVSMEFSIKRHWYAGDTGFAHMSYTSKLRSRREGAMLVDRRENLIVGHREHNAGWRIIAKITIRRGAGADVEASLD